MSKKNKIDEFIDDCDADKTKSLYRSSLTLFFKVIGKNPDTYVDGKQEYESDIRKFRKYLIDNPPPNQTIRASKGIRGYLIAIKSFLTFHKVKVDDYFWKKLMRKTKGTRATTRFETPTNEQIKQILQYANIKYKALFLLLSSSGMRIGETLQLTTGDINFDTNSIHIKAEYTKTKEDRTTFFTPETKDAIEEWLKHREENLKESVKKSKAFGCNKSIDDKRVFPINVTSANHSWKRLLKKAGFDEKDERTNITRMGIHELRKFFSSNLKLSPTPDIIVEALSGHQEGLSYVYDRYTEEQLKQEYEKGRHKLYVFEREVADERIQDLEEKITQGKKETDILRDKVELLARFKGITEGDEYLDGEGMIKAFDEIDDSLDILDELSKRIKKGKEKPSAKEDELQQMKKKMKDMMKQLEELEGK